jgi:hypothetical protein
MPPPNDAPAFGTEMRLIESDRKELHAEQFFFGS